jgi:hypothetical protein
MNTVEQYFKTINLQGWVAERSEAHGGLGISPAINGTDGQRMLPQADLPLGRTEQPPLSLGGLSHIYG